MNYVKKIFNATDGESLNDIYKYLGDWIQQQENERLKKLVSHPMFKKVFFKSLQNVTNVELQIGFESVILKNYENNSIVSFEFDGFDRPGKIGAEFLKVEKTKELSKELWLYTDTLEFCNVRVSTEDEVIPQEISINGLLNLNPMEIVNGINSFKNVSLEYAVRFLGHDGVATVGSYKKGSTEHLEKSYCPVLANENGELAPDLSNTFYREEDGEVVQHLKRPLDETLLYWDGVYHTNLEENQQNKL